MIPHVFQVIVQAVQHRHHIVSFVRQQWAHGKKLPLMLLGLLFALTVTIAMPVAAANPAVGIPYFDPQGRFSLQVLASWVQLSDADYVVAWASDAQVSAANFAVYRDTIPAGEYSAEYARVQQLLLAAQLPGYTQLNQRTLRIAGQQATVFDATFTYQGATGTVTMHDLAVYLTQGSVGWMLEFAAPADRFARYTDDGNLLIASFTLS